jgi:hypothetical protein
MIKDKMNKLNNSMGQEELNKEEQVKTDEGKMNIVTKFI